ncbi:MAG: T9SS type A sorting domain-containing protein [Ginsengibacter sp.]
MKKLYSLTSFLLCLNMAFSQWTKITAIPSPHIVAMTTHNGSIYSATDSNIIYKSEDGITWKSISLPSDSIDISTLGFYNNNIYAGTFRSGVFSSIDDGLTWRHNSLISHSTISGFAVKNSRLFAATFGDGVYALDAGTGNWVHFANSLPDYSVNVQNIIGTPNFLLIGAGSNGTFYRYNFAGNEWNEAYYFGRLRPSLQINKMINRGDTLLAVNGNRIIKSNDAGESWSEDKVGTHNGADRNVYEGSASYYILTNLFSGGTWIQQRDKNAARGTSWTTNEDFFIGGFSYGIIEFNSTLFLARDNGLYFKNLTGPLQVQFILFNERCERGKVALNWKMVKENNSSHFNIERSADGIHFEILHNLSVTSSSHETTYSFADENPVPGAFYRIAVYDHDDHVQYSKVLQSACTATDSFELWPNPTHDMLFINIVAPASSDAMIRIFDGKGALVCVQKAKFFQGANRVKIAMGSLANGAYLLYAGWQNGQRQRIWRVIKR